MSEKINTGGPAFPVSTRPLKHETEFGHQDSPSTWQYGGMTMRDYFAAKAMHGVMTMYKPTIDGATLTIPHHAEQVADIAYAMADAMLKAREGDAE